MKQLGKKLLLGIGLLITASMSPAEELPILEGIGGNFTAQGSTGTPVSLKDFENKAVLLFFGYTNCPDVCPVTLSHITALMRSLGVAEKQGQVLFVTLDPEADTPAYLNGYLKHFHPDYIGLSGTRDEIDRIVDLFKARYERKVERQVTTRFNRYKSHSDEFYVYSHSQQIYLLDPQGNTRALFYTGTPIDEMREGVLQLLAEADVGGNRLSVSPAIDRR